MLIEHPPRPAFIEGEIIVVHRVVLQAKQNRDRWEEIESKDAHFWQVAVCEGVSSTGAVSHASLDGNGPHGKRLDNSTAALRIRESFKIDQEYRAECYKVIGEVFSSRESLVSHIKERKGG